MLKAKIKPCKVSLWYKMGYPNSDLIYEKYGTEEWFEVEYSYGGYYPKELDQRDNFLKEDLVIKEFE